MRTSCRRSRGGESRAAVRHLAQQYRAGDAAVVPPHGPSLVHGDHDVGKVGQLVELGRGEQHGHPPPRRVARTGMTVEHPKYGKGTVVRREGEGENAKITVNFPHHGLKKLVEKYAGLKRD